MKMTRVSTFTGPYKLIDDRVNDEIQSMNEKGWEVENVNFRCIKFSTVSVLVTYKKDTDPFKNSEPDKEEQ